MSTIIENLLDDSEQPELLSPKTKNLTDGDFNIIDTTNCTLMCFNINSITHGDRLHELADINNEISAEFIALVETKLDDTISQSIYKIPGYICEAKHRSRHGGGVILYIKEDIPYQRKKNLENKNLEHIACEAIVGSEKYLINVIYRPPNETPEAHDQFISNIEDTLIKINKHKADTRLLCGDFNFGSNFNWGGGLRPKPLDEKGTDTFSAAGYDQLIDIPTRYGSDFSVSLIDLIFIDKKDNLINVATLPQLADHQGTLATFNTKSFKKPTKTFLKYDYSNANWNNIKNDLHKLMNNNLYDNENIDDLANCFSKILIDTRNHNVPHTLARVKNGELPWHNKDIKRLIRRKNRLHKKFTKSSLTLKTNDTLNTDEIEILTRTINCQHDNFKKASRQYEYAVRKEKLKYFKNLKQTLSSPDVPSQKKFDKIKQVTNTTKNDCIPPIIENDQVIHDPKDKAQLFNQMFANKSVVIGNDDPVPELPPLSTLYDLKEIGTTKYEIGPILKDMKKSNFSPCSIPSNFLLLLYDKFGSLITNPITKLLNKIFQSGTYPELWKIQNITPIYKNKGARTDKTMYRPISILPTLSKICESILHNRLLHHLMDNNIITQKQAAYLKGDSCSQQLLYIVHNIKKAWAHDQISHACYLDIEGAFDRVWHRGMLAKLQQINVKGKVHKLLTSYLSNRKARTNIEGSLSDLVDVLAGVPQGSRLGPLLFLIYINDIAENLESNASIFADDTTLISTGNDPAETAEVLNRDLKKISQWSDEWKLTFNPGKTYDMIFSKKLLNNSPQLTLNSVDITRINKHKHLGVILTSDLSWDDHLSLIIKRTNLKLSNLYRNKYLSRRTLDTIYKMNIRSCIDYCCQVWGPSLNETQISKIDKVQYRAAKIVSGAMYRTSSSALRNELGWESTKDRINYLSIIHFNKIQSNRTRPLIRTCLPPRNENPLDLRVNRRYKPFPEEKNRVFSNSFFPKMAKLWDDLPHESKCGSTNEEIEENLANHFKPVKNKLYSYGSKLGNKLQTQLRLGRSQLNSHLYDVGLSLTKKCACGSPIEDTYHMIFNCPNYADIRTDLFDGLENCLVKKIKFYSKNQLMKILLFGENTEDNERFPFNKIIFRKFQTFLLKSKRLVYNQL